MNLDQSLTTIFSTGKKMTSGDSPSLKINPSCSCPSGKVSFNTFLSFSHQPHSTAKVSGLPSPELLFTTPKLHCVQCSSLTFPPWSCFLGAAFLPSHSSTQRFICSIGIIFPILVHFSLGSPPFPSKPTNLIL